MIRKQVTCGPAVIEELKRIIAESEGKPLTSLCPIFHRFAFNTSMRCVLILVMKEDDNLWPEPDRVGEQQLEIKIGNGIRWPTPLS
jgi:hypothetical protein